MSDLDELTVEVREALEEMFGDTSVSPEETAHCLRYVIDECNMYLEALKQDGVDIGYG